MSNRQTIDLTIMLRGCSDCDEKVCGVAQVAMQQTAVDPTTGTIDMDLIQTGISAGERVARSHLTSELQALIQSAMLPLLPFAPLVICTLGNTALLHLAQQSQALSMHYAE